MEVTVGVVMITGASSGLGAALALEMGRRGYAVGLVARRADRLESLARELREQHVGVCVAPADVADERAVEKAVAVIEEALGQVDVCVANAGVEGTFRAHDIRMKAIRRTFDVNVYGAIHCVKAVLPGMLERDGGHLVVVSSVAATRGLPKSATYSASKAAISVFWEGLRVDLSKTNVHTTILHPGFVKTEMTAKNDFPMPFLLDVEEAARLMADAIESKRTSYTFPRQMKWAERVLRRLPNRVFDRLVSRAR